MFFDKFTIMHIFHVLFKTENEETAQDLFCSLVGT